MEIVNHHLIDIVDPDYHFTAGDFCVRASAVSKEIAGRGKLPLLVGGTGFYVDSFCYGIDEIPDIDESVKKAVELEYDSGGSDLLYEELSKVDSGFASKVHKNDRQRIIRGISVFRDTGKPISSFFSGKEKNKNFETFFIGLNVEKDCLLKRIDERVDSMVKKGFIDEVKVLRSMGYSSSLNSMQSIGYAEMNRYIDGMITIESAIDDIKRNTKKYAKKQMTWFEKNKNVVWFNSDEIKKIPDIVKKWLNLY